MLKGRSPKMIGSGAWFVIGFPERVEVEPLLRRLQAVVRQTVGITLGPSCDHLLTITAPPLDGLGKGLEYHAVTARPLEAENQVDRALQQAGEQPWALRESRRMTEEVAAPVAPSVWRPAAAGDRQPLPAVKALAQLQHDRRVQLADLYQ